MMGRVTAKWASDVGPDPQGTGSIRPRHAILGGMNCLAQHIETTGSKEPKRRRRSRLRMEDAFHDLGGTAVRLLVEAGRTGPSGTAQKIPERNPVHVQRRQVRSGAMIVATKRRKPLSAGQSLPVSSDWNVMVGVAGFEPTTPSPPD